MSNMIRPFRKIATSIPPSLMQGAPDHAVLKRWHKDLETARHALEEINASSEKGFIDIASLLMDFHKRAANMYTTSRSVVQLMTGEGFTGITQGLSHLLEDLHTMLGDSREQLKKISGGLNHYHTILGRVKATREAFTGLVLNLNMLGFLIRVENAHLISTNTGFASLTGDVKRLTELIKVKSQDIDTRAGTVLTSIDAAIKGIQAFEETRGAYAGTMLEETLTHHRTLSGRYAAAVTAAERIACMTNRIADSTYRVVESLQFHDISRQQIEHVVQAINTLCGHIDSPQCTYSDRVVLMRNMCALQSAQLGQTQAELMAAMEQVKSGLAEISHDVGQIVHATRETTLAEDTTGVMFMDRVSGGIEAVMDGLDATTTEEAGLLETVRSTCEQISLMTGFVREIEELGLHLQLIALNARIKATHLGREGAALDAISSNIYALSHAARRDTQNLSEVLAELREISQVFEGDLGQVEDHKRESAHILMTNMADLKTSLAQVNDTVQGLIDELCSQGNSLIQDIEAGITHITVHSEMQAVLQNVMALMEGIHDDASAVDLIDAPPATTEFLADLDRLYTMQSERHIHQKHTEQACPENEIQPEAISTDDLGENVEFF